MSLAQHYLHQIELENLLAPYKEIRDKVYARSPKTREKKAKSTINEYYRVFSRYKTLTKHDCDKTKNKIEAVVCKRTWFKDRAALLFFYSKNLDRTISELEESNGKIKTEIDWRIQQCNRYSAILNMLMEISYEGPRKPVDSKRKILNKLPTDWRELIYKRSKKYKEALLVMTLCGCRPSELVLGALVEIDSDKLMITIQGTKVTKDSGQPWRKIHIRIAGRYAEALASIVKAVGGKKLIEIKSAENFSSTITSAGKKEFSLKKFSITAYCYRQQLASDLKLHMKLSGDDDLLISQLLGHYSSMTKKAYGYPRSGKSMVAPVLNVETSRPVKIISTNPPYLRKPGRKRGM